MFNKKKELFFGFENLTIVTPSKWLADRVKQSFLGDKDIRVVHNGIDTDNIFHPRDFSHIKVKHDIKNEKIILAVAPNLLSPAKSGDWVIKLAARLKDNTNIKFILIGVDNLSEKFDDNIIALGRISDQNELAEYYSIADIFLICSKRENFPTTCIEALSCGAPIVGFDGGGTKETAPDGFGVFVEYGNLELLEGAIHTFLEKPFDNQVISENAKKMYSSETMINEYTSLYME
jgi:glycosyltransferase involved in cell wall biosynthesis